MEDEQEGADLLMRFINEYFPEADVLGHAKSVDEAVTLIQKKQPTIIFLDIEIFGGTGFDVLDRIDNKSSKVIFCTGYDQHAIRAFKYSAVDYLLKPLSIDEFIDAVNRAKTSLDQDLAIKALQTTRDVQSPPHIIISVKSGFIKIKIDDILRIKAEGSYSEFELENGSTQIASRPIGYFEDLLPAETFIRVHHSAIVNIARVVEYDNVLGTIKLENGVEQPVSVRKRKFLNNKKYK